MLILLTLLLLLQYPNQALPKPYLQSALGISAAAADPVDVWETSGREDSGVSLPQVLPNHSSTGILSQEADKTSSVIPGSQDTAKSTAMIDTDVGQGDIILSDVNSDDNIHRKDKSTDVVTESSQWEDYLPTIRSTMEDSGTTISSYEDISSASSSIVGELYKADEDLENDTTAVANMASIVDSEQAKAQIDVEIKDLEDLKDKIAILENHMRKHADFHLIENEELVKTDNMLRDIDIQILQPYEEQLLALRSQIQKNKEGLNDEDLERVNKIIKNAEDFLQTGREKIEDVEELELEWENAEEIETLDSDMEENYDNNLDNEEVPEERISYEHFRKEKMTGDHSRAHQFEDYHAMVNAEILEADDYLNSKPTNFSSMHPFLTPGLTMLVFLLLCSAVAYKVTRRRRKAGRWRVSEVMARDLGYTELQSAGKGALNRKENKLK